MTMPATRLLTCELCRESFIATRRRGTPPRFCTDAHRLAAAAQSKRERRAAAKIAPPYRVPRTPSLDEASGLLERAHREAARRRAVEAVEVAEERRARRAVPSPRTGEEVTTLTSTPETWSARNLVPVAQDAALLWMMENHPEDAADFERARK